MKLPPSVGPSLCRKAATCKKFDHPVTTTPKEVRCGCCGLEAPVRVWGGKPRLLAPLASPQAFTTVPSSVPHALPPAEDTSLLLGGLPVTQHQGLGLNNLKEHPTFPASLASGVGGALTVHNSCLLSPLPWPGPLQTLNIKHVLNDWTGGKMDRGVGQRYWGTSCPSDRKIHSSHLLLETLLWV